MKRKKKKIKSRKFTPDIPMRSYRFTPDMPIPIHTIPLCPHSCYTSKLKIPKYHGDK